MWDFLLKVQKSSGKTFAILSNQRDENRAIGEHGVQSIPIHRVCIEKNYTRIIQNHCTNCLIILFQ